MAAEASGPPNDDRTRRWLGIAGAVAVVAIPIVLIVATWRPLEPPPKAERPAIVQEEQAPENPREERRNRRDAGESGEQTPRSERDRDADFTPVVATPFP